MSGSGEPTAWLPDPTQRFQYRYWDGSLWSDQVSNQGSQQSDPLSTQPLPPPVSAAARPSAVGPGEPAPQAAPAIKPWSGPVRVLIFGGAAVLAAGSLLPWVKVSVGFLTVTKNGTDGDGVLTLILAGLVALLFWLVKPHITAAVLVLILGGLGGIIAVYDIIDLSNRAHSLLVSSNLVSASIGIGLILAGLASLVIVVGAIIGISEAKSA